MPVVGHVGSDYERSRPDFRVIDDPFRTGQRVLLVPAIRPDVALLHALAAAPDGTLVLDPQEDDALLAQASRRVIASAERILPLEELRRLGSGVVLEGIHVDAVVDLPGGAYPTRVPGITPLDAAHVADYADAARTQAGFAAYLARWILEGPAGAILTGAARA